MSNIVPQGGMPIDGGALAVVIQAEISSQVATARAYPRKDIRVIAHRIADLATLDEDTAEECLYVLTRGSKRKGRDDEEAKPIEGPSIRLAEIAAQQYGNCRIEARVVEVNRKEKYVEAEGTFLDLETNMASKSTVRRRISTSQGGLFSEDMIIVTGNAACAIAKRNAILAGIPKALYRPAYAEARKMLAGDATTLGANRDKAINSFKRFGVTSAQILEALGVPDEASLTPDHIAQMRGMYGTLMRKEATVAEMFAKEATEHKVVSAPLSDAKPAEQSDDELGDEI